MEATEDQRCGLMDQLVPPRLEDAGLEDCALPPDSITEAFLRAATAVRSRAAAILTSDDDEEEAQSDVVVGDLPESPGPCVVTVKGGEEDKGGIDCVDGLRGLEIGDDKDSKKKRNGCGDDDDEEKPILVGGFA